MTALLLLIIAILLGAGEALIVLFVIAGVLFTLVAAVFAVGYALFVVAKVAFYTVLVGYHVVRSLLTGAFGLIVRACELYVWPALDRLLKKLEGPS